MQSWCRPGKKQTEHALSYKFMVDREDITMCKRAFKATLDVSDGRIPGVVNSMHAHGRVAQSILRGKPTPKRLSTSSIDHVKAHIESFSADISHYSRKDNPGVKYLSSELNIRKMYGLYKDKCKEDGQEPIKETYCRKVFNEDCNMRFSKLKTDTCDTCDHLDVNIADAQNSEGQANPRALKAQKAVHPAKP